MNTDFERIIVVDDTEAVAVMLTQFLREEGFSNVESYGCPRQALEEISNNGPTFIVTDFRMPGMNGGELLERARRVDPRNTGIIMTANPDDIPRAFAHYPAIEKTTRFLYEITEFVRNRMRELCGELSV